MALILVSAYYLTAIFLTLPFDMPYCVDMAIRSGFRLFLHDDMPAPEDMGVIAVLMYFVCACVFASLIVGPIGVFAWRRIISPRLN